MSVFSISIVSHGHARYIIPLLRSLAALGRSDIEVILTINYPEQFDLDFAALPYPLQIIENPVRKGFAANHNAAFAASTGHNFVILNPDIELIGDPFAPLAILMQQMPGALYAPVVLNHLGELEDSMRFFPSPPLLFKKLVAKMLHLKMRNDVVPSTAEVLMPDWVAGMFIVVPRALYSELKGLNERYHMYYEDVDLCARARLGGHPVLVSRNAQVVHEAQRDSHRKLQYLLWHMLSALKFFTSEAYLKINLRRAFGHPLPSHK
jgi:hypothetical protein